MNIITKQPWACGLAVSVFFTVIHPLSGIWQFQGWNHPVVMILNFLLGLLAGQEWKKNE